MRKLPTTSLAAAVALIWLLAGPSLAGTTSSGTTLSAHQRHLIHLRQTATLSAHERHLAHQEHAARLRAEARTNELANKTSTFSIEGTGGLPATGVPIFAFFSRD